MSNDIQQHIGKNIWLHARGKERSQAATMLLSRPEESLSQANIEQREVANKNFGDILYHGAEQRRSY